MAEGRQPSGPCVMSLSSAAQVIAPPIFSLGNRSPVTAFFGCRHIFATAAGRLPPFRYKEQPQAASLRGLHLFQGPVSMPNRSQSPSRLFCLTALLSTLVLAFGCDRQATTPSAQSASTPAPAEPPVPPRQEGTWSAVSAIMAGAAFPAQVTNTITLAITGDQYVVDVGGQPDKGTCVTDTTQSPQRMTITGTEGPNAGKTLLAIADFPSEGEMRICYDMAGKKFPETFESTAENGHFLVTYRKTP
jgi:uncharacterized protein (TIGR03067 family)